MSSIEHHRLVTGLAQQRRDAGLTQVELAIRANCSRSTIALLEAGYQPRHSDVLPRLRAVLDASHHDDLEPAANGLQDKNGEATPHDTAY